MSWEFSKEKERLETLVKGLDDEIAVLEAKRGMVHDRRRIAEAYSTAPRLDRVMVEKLVDHVSVGKRDKVTREVPVEIHWNF